MQLVEQHVNGPGWEGVLVPLRRRGENSCSGERRDVRAGDEHQHDEQPTPIDVMFLGTVVMVVAASTMVLTAVSTPRRPGRGTSTRCSEFDGVRAPAYA